ncbi:MAG TPA: hypothetical protein QGH16_01205 [Verrucomicrobiota bacterium]|jgi:hypothetical protein|nr:hypothetical protein [Verrucomicrobiota bacterium]
MTLTPIIRLARRRAFLQLDVAIALTVLTLVFIPLSVSSSGGLDLARRHYFEAVALQLIDGEMDVLLAGERRKYTPGEHRIKPVGEAVQNLPEGEFVLSLQDQKLTLAWMPKKFAKWGRVERVVQLK